MEFRNAYERCEHKGKVFVSPSMTQQHFAPECDVNKIIARYTATGFVPDELVRSGNGVYGDFSNVEDFQTMQNKIIAARASFESLPSEIRRRFNDDPAQLISFVRDEGNYDEAVKLGIVKKRIVKVDESVVETKPE